MSHCDDAARMLAPGYRDPQPLRPACGECARLRARVTELEGACLTALSYFDCARPIADWAAAALAVKDKLRAALAERGEGEGHG